VCEDKNTYGYQLKCQKPVIKIKYCWTQRESTHQIIMCLLYPFLRQWFLIQLLSRERLVSNKVRSWKLSTSYRWGKISKPSHFKPLTEQLKNVPTFYIIILHFPLWILFQFCISLFTWAQQNEKYKNTKIHIKLKYILSQQTWAAFSLIANVFHTHFYQGMIGYLFVSEA